MDSSSPFLPLLKNYNKFKIRGEQCFPPSRRPSARSKARLSEDEHNVPCIVFLLSSLREALCWPTGVENPRLSVSARSPVDPARLLWPSRSPLLLFSVSLVNAA